MRLMGWWERSRVTCLTKLDQNHSVFLFVEDLFVLNMEICPEGRELAFDFGFSNKKAPYRRRPVVLTWNQLLGYYRVS